MIQIHGSRINWNSSGFTTADEIKFSFVASVISLHILRNLSPVLYLLLYSVAMIIIFTDVFRKRSFVSSSYGSAMYFSYIFFSIVTFFISILLISTGGALVGLSRFLFASPIFFAFLLYSNTISKFEYSLRFLGILYALFCLTVPLQLVTGPISWFADSSERAGFVRYASLHGSLTSLGTTCGMYCFFTMLNKTSLVKLLSLSAIILGAVVSLSKSAFVNLGLAFPLLFLLMNRGKERNNALLILIISLFAIFFLQNTDISGSRVSASLTSFGFEDETARNYDVSATDSAVDRLTDLPLKTINNLLNLPDPIHLVFGGGFGMADTALVPPEDSLSEMAHNQFVELFAIGGIFAGAFFIFFLLFILVKLGVLFRSTFFRNENIKLIRVVFFAYFSFFIGAIFANGIMYQPAGAIIMWCALYFCTNYKQLEANSK
jgi:hypothetical protein